MIQLLRTSLSGNTSTNHHQPQVPTPNNKSAERLSEVSDNPPLSPIATTNNQYTSITENFSLLPTDHNSALRRAHQCHYQQCQHDSRDIIISHDLHRVTYHNPDTNSPTVIRPWNSQATNDQDQLVMLSTTQSASVPPVTSYTSVKYAVPATAPRRVPTGIGLLSKPTPWTPLRPFILERELRNHPDNAFIKQLINDLCHGCFIGYKGPQFSYSVANLVSAYQQPTIIDVTLAKECQLGRILGPCHYPPLPNFRILGLGLVPKHDGGWRIIYHLSAPPYISINKFIDPDDYSLSYCTIDAVYDFINQMGPGTLLSKINLKDTFRLIPVHLSQWNLLGICWKTRFYMDTCLPFGLRSAPYLFNGLSEAIHWILVNKYGVQHLLHYLDDFITAGLPD